MRNLTCVLFGLILLVGGVWNGARLSGQTNMVQTHIGHVMTNFQPTPKMEGLLPTALAEAKIAAAHAAFAAKTPDNLDAMKLHAGHVIHALDPSVEAKGPGLGFGAKKAAAGVAQHIDLAAKTDGASANVKMHATHVSAAANSAAKRSDEVVALAQKVRSASSASEAAPLVAQMNTLAQELTAGTDVNKDGKVNWGEGEGGLQHAQQHMEFMVKGEAAGK
jgi:hypothetical protein